MSAYLNQVILIGRVGKKPEINKSQNDDRKIAKFSLATTEHWKDKETQERKEKTEWHKVVVYSSKIAEVIENYVDEGSLVCVEGKLKYEKWVDPQGVERKLTNIVIDLNGKFMMLERRKSSDNHQSSNNFDKMDSEPNEDDIPF